MRLLIKLFALILLLGSFFILYDRYDLRQPIAFEALQQIDPLPKTKALIAKGQLSQAEDYLTFLMDYPYMKNNLQAKNLLLDIKLKRTSSAYKQEKILQGIITGKSDETEGQIAAGVSDLFLVGDLRDLAIEGYHHLSDQKVDKTLVALSSIGVFASAATLLSAGTTIPAKGSISFLKFAKKSGKLPTWLNKYLIKAAKEIKHTKELRSIKTLFNELSILIKHAGLNGGLRLLKQTKGVDSLKVASSFAKTYGKNSSALFMILGKDTLRLKKGLNKEAFAYAATYGKTGVKRLRRLGGKGFLKSLKAPVKVSRLAKVFDKHSLALLKNIPDGVFYALGLVAIMILA